MDTTRSKCVAWVRGNADDLNRAILKEQFQRFGKVTKIYVDASNGYAKVYFEQEKNVKEACAALTGFRSWDCYSSKDNWLSYYGDRSNKRDTKPFSDSHSLAGSFGGDMEETCFSAGEFVDIHGRRIEVLQAENGQLFVSYDDIRASGFNIYSRDTYSSTVVSKGEDLRHFENYLLNQGKKYILNYKKSFNEDEVLDMLERVRVKLTGKSSREPDMTQGRLISNTAVRNFSITAANNLDSGSGRGGQRPGRQLHENFLPTFSFRTNKPQEVRTNHDYNNGYGVEGRVDRAPSQNTRNNNYEPQHSRNFDDNNKSRGGDRRPDSTLWEKRDNDNNSQLRKPKGRDFPAANNTRQEKDERWEEDLIEPQKSRMPPLNVKRIELPVGSTQKLSVTCIEANKKGIFFAQNVENSSVVDEILLHVNSIDCSLPEITEPKRDMLCCVFFEDCWYRGVVVQPRQPPAHALVELIDYGNRETITTTPLRELSEEMRAIAGQAVRCASHNPGETDPVVEQVLEVFVKKHYDDSTHVVEIRGIVEAEGEAASPDSHDSSDREPARVERQERFMQVPPTEAKIVTGTIVQIVNYTDSHLILRNKETALVCKDVYAHIASMVKIPLESPVVGQICLCGKDGDEGLHRAVIRTIGDRTADLEYLEFKGGVTLSTESLRNVDEYLAGRPRAIVEQPYGVLKALNADAGNFLLDLIVGKKKLKAVRQDDSLDYQLADGALLSTRLEALLAPAAATSAVDTPTRAAGPAEPKATPGPQNRPPSAGDEKTITYNEMPYCRPSLGVGQYTCYACTGDSVTLVSLAEENVAHLTELLGIEEPSGGAEWAAREFDMCLAKFQDLWYRAVVMEAKQDEYFVFFVDFGNSEDVRKADVRRLPGPLAAIPMLGISATFDGIPDDAAVKGRLQELCADDIECEVNVKKYADDDETRCLIEIPCLYERLRLEGLI